MIFTNNLLSKLGIYLIAIILIQCNSPEEQKSRPRILISSDIGGTDPDDFQSMIHLLLYANLFNLEGFVSSPYGPGRKDDFLDMIKLYEQDFNKLSEQQLNFPSPNALKNICKQGAIKAAPYKGFTTATEGSEWIIKCAKKPKKEPLWILVWGGLEDLAQALHDAPEIKNKIKVYWIGGPNKKWSVNAYAYIAENHPDLYMIEANATYRGWFMDDDSQEKLKSKNFYKNYIHGHGAMAENFKNHYDGEIKMGDTPSLAYVMNGNTNNPTTESWGGSFAPIKHSSRVIFRGNTTTNDTVPAYAVLEWRFKGPKKNISLDSICFTMEISNQVWPGFYLGDGNYGVRYSSKKPETESYKTASDIPELNGQTGKYVSITTWPGKPNSNDYAVGPNWYGDRTELEFYIDNQQGAKTISKHRKAFLMDWAKRWKWISN